MEFGRKLEIIIFLIRMSLILDMFNFKCMKMGEVAIFSDRSWNQRFGFGSFRILDIYVVYVYVWGFKRKDYSMIQRKVDVDSLQILEMLWV